MQKGMELKGGFALPTVLIASVVLLMVLTVSISSVVAVRTTLLTQYYEQLAKTAGEAGVAYAKACLAKNGNVPLWSDAKPLKPNTDCAGNDIVGDTSFSALIVAGGGSGGGSTGGGGGAGGVVELSSLSLTEGSYPVVVGAGAAPAGNKAVGKDGGDSSFNGTTAIGGGGGGYSASSTVYAAGRSGGSGGGGQRYGGTANPGAGTAGQGYAGGSLTGAGTGSTTGGGGAGGVGLNTAVTNAGGAGGPGKLSTITGEPVYYGGGGGAGGNAGTSGPGGIGGGGAGGEIGVAGTANTGGGGGGGWSYAGGNSGAGGSGIVVIAYPNNGTIDATGGNSVYVNGLYKIHKFTSTGSATFQVNSVRPSSCPSDPRCSVISEPNLRSSFSVGLPTLDAEGKAVAIPNTGFVELLRTSGGGVWRTYRQPSVQAAVVPGLCSGSATSSLGWSNAVAVSTPTTLPNAPAARNISLASGDVAAGKLYFRKDFQVSKSGSYVINVDTPSSANQVTIYVDDELVASSDGSVASGTKTLSTGCHTITAQLTNKTVLDASASFIASVRQNVTDASAIVVSDSSWRVSTGATVDFSNPDFYADPDTWTRTRDMGPAMAITSNWGPVSGDHFSRMVIGACSVSCPPSSYTYLRDGRDVYLTSPRTVRISVLCDDDCRVYLDGQQIITRAIWTSISQQTITLPAGSHHVAATLINAGAAANGSKFGMTMVDVETGEVLTRTDSYWQASDVWQSGTSPSSVPYSYEASFLPSPLGMDITPTADVLVVAGGGGSGSNSYGGGGAGGLIYRPGTELVEGTTYTVTVGAGGVMGTNVGTTTAARGQNGGNSVFGSFVAIGGGGGASRDTGPGPSSGGSGGGGSGTTVAGRDSAAGGVAGQGFAGGNGTPADQGVGAKGGGGGGAGGPGVTATTAVAGNGGPGFITYMTGSLESFAGGGGGGNTASNGTLGMGTDGGGGGAAQRVNRGGGGGNGYGHGSSGIVLVRIKTGTMSITPTGTYTVANVTIDGTAYTVYRFTGSGTFKVNSIN